jgi:hypothetical protein
MSYIKVWIPRSNRHLLIELFDPSDSSAESAAYEKAATAMVANPEARWAVSEKCFGACAGIPVVGVREPSEIMQGAS